MVTSLLLEVTETILRNTIIKGKCLRKKIEGKKEEKEMAKIKSKTMNLFCD